MMRLLLCAAAPLCLFAAQAQAQAQDTVTATGTCKKSAEIEEVLRDKLGATRFRTANCDTMVSVPNKSVSFTRAGASHDSVVFAGSTDEEGDLSITTVTFGITSAPIRVELGFCNGGPVEDGEYAMVCSALYKQGDDSVGITVIFEGKPRN